MSEQSLRGSASRDFDGAIRDLSAWIRDTDSFTQVIARWTRAPVEYELRSRHRVPVDAGVAARLDLRPDAAITERRGVLRAGLGEARAVLADVRSRVAEQRLGWSARRKLEFSDVPLGAVLSRYEVRRHTHAVTRLQIDDELGRQVLRVDATLTVAGVPVAIVDERVYAAVLEHRLDDEGN